MRSRYFACVKDVPASHDRLHNNHIHCRNIQHSCRTQRRNYNIISHARTKSIIFYENDRLPIKPLEALVYDSAIFTYVNFLFFPKSEYNPVHAKTGNHIKRSSNIFVCELPCVYYLYNIYHMLLGMYPSVVFRERFLFKIYSK